MTNPRETLCLAARLLANVVFCMQALAVMVFLYWGYENFFAPSSIVSGTTVKGGPGPYHPGEVLDVEFTAIRYKTCNIESSRLMERVSDRREFRVQFVTLVIFADTPSRARTEGYRLVIPRELTTGKYLVYSRLRYYCNGLDYLVPRYRTTPSYEIEVVT